MKGILFKPEMIQAIREGRKTETRRVVKESNSKVGVGKVDWSKFCWDGREVYTETCQCPSCKYEHRIQAPQPCADGSPDEQYLHVPYNWADDMTVYRIYPRLKVGEAIYVKEAMCFECYGKASPQLACYKDGDNEDCDSALWVSPLFMPEWAARTFLTIQSIRAERLQEISFESCLAEGIVGTTQWIEMTQGDTYKPPEPLNPDDLSLEECDKEIDRGWVAFTQQAYARLWNTINPKHPWESNPWVWVYTLNVATKATGHNNKQTQEV